MGRILSLAGRLFGLGKSTTTAPPQPKAARSRRVRIGPAGVTMPWFLPYHGNASGLDESPGMRAAYRKMLSSPRVKPALLGKLLSVAGLELQILPADKRNPRDKQIAEGVKYILDERIQGEFPGVAWDVLSSACIDGVSVSFKNWGVENRGRWTGKHILRSLDPVDLGRDAQLEVNEFGRVSAIQGLGYNSGEKWDPKDFLIFRHLPLYGSPVGMSDFRAAYASYWMLDTVWKLRMIGVEKRALPMLMGTYVAGSQKRGLEDALERAKSASWMSVPQGAKVEAINIAGQAEEIFAATVKDLNEDILLSIQGALLQSITGGGGESRGSSMIHKDTADLMKWFLSAMLATAFNDREGGLIPEIVNRNWAGVSEYPRAVLSGVDEAELGESLRVDTGLAQMGVSLSKADVYERYGRAMPENADDALVMPGAAVGGGLAAAGPDGGGDFAGMLAGTADPSDPMAPAPTGAGSSDLRATVGGSQAIAALQVSYYAGEIPRTAALAQAQLVFGFSPDEAEKLFPDEEPLKLTPPEEGEAPPPEAPNQPVNPAFVDTSSVASSVSAAVSGGAAASPFPPSPTSAKRPTSLVAPPRSRRSSAGPASK